MFSDEAIKILNFLGEKFGIAIDWTSKNVAPYLKDLGNRIINLEIASSIFWIVLVAVITGIAWIFNI